MAKSRPPVPPASPLVRPPVLPPIEPAYRPPAAAEPEPVAAPAAPVRRCQKCQSTHTRLLEATADHERHVCLEPHCGREFRVHIAWDFGLSRRCECGSLETKLSGVGGGWAWRDCSRCGRRWKVAGIRL